MTLQQQYRQHSAPTSLSLPLWLQRVWRWL
jgi:hypothetical protein